MNEIQERLFARINDFLAEKGGRDVRHALEFPADPAHGDLASNAAMAAAKSLGVSPRSLAEELVEALRTAADPDVSTVEIAGPGFVNIRLSDTALHRMIEAAAGPDRTISREEGHYRVYRPESVQGVSHWALDAQYHRRSARTTLCCRWGRGASRQLPG